MGAALDPENPLYSDGDRGMKAPAPEVRSAPAAKPAGDLDQFSGVTATAMAAAMAASQPEAEEIPAVAEAVVEEVADDSAVTLDFDLGGGTAQFAEEAEAPAMDIIDFDLGGAPAEASPVAEEIVPPAANEERDFTETLVSFGGPEGLDDTAGKAVDLDLSGAAPAGQGAVAGDLGDFTVDFEIADLQPTAAPAPATVSEPELSVPEFDLSSINLDLGAGLAEPSAPAAAPGSGSGSGSGEDVSTKLALAKAYDEMGDQDQARELLREVIAEGGGELAAEARAILTRLGG